MHKQKLLMAASLALVLLTACGTSDIFGGGGGSSPRTTAYDIRGVVDSVDPSSRSLVLRNVSGYTSMLSSSSDSVRVYFDDQTTVEYQNTAYRPEDLERGDEVSVRVDESGSRLMADSVTVLRDVSTGGSSGVYSTNVRGTVRSVNTSRGTVEIANLNGGTSIVEFDTNTQVHYGSQTFRVADLERGDEVDIRVRDLGSSRLVAQDITVTRNVSGGTSGSGSSQVSTLRGTVRYVDTSRRTIELESANWISGLSNNFNGGTGSGGKFIIQYPSSISIDVNGSPQSVAGLERGDVIEVQVRSLGGSSYQAERIWLVRDVNR